ncbi:hypothetical protein A2U01_0062104, partial [Trifolium medium]|nr:hypothetical protein [Trifolium medium]
MEGSMPLARYNPSKMSQDRMAWRIPVDKKSVVESMSSIALDSMGKTKEFLEESRPLVVRSSGRSAYLVLGIH